MKLYFVQLESHLIRKPAPLYLISGEEIFLRQEAINQIRKAAKYHGIAERKRLQPETGFNWDGLYTELHTPSLLSNACLIEIDLRNVRLTQTATQILKSYADKPCPEQIVVVQLNKLDEKITKSAWYQSWEKNGVSLTLWPLTRDQLITWVIKRTHKYKMQIGQSEAELIANLTEGNIAAAAQGLEKIYLMHPTEKISSERIREAMSCESHFSIFDFIDNLLSGKPSRVLHILKQLEDEAVEPVLILWAITRELRILAELVVNQSKGIPLDQVFKKHRIFPRHQIIVKQYLKTFSLTQCWNYLLKAEHIDKIIKGSSPDHIWNALQLFCLSLTTSSEPQSSDLFQSKFYD